MGIEFTTASGAARLAEPITIRVRTSMDALALAMALMPTFAGSIGKAEDLVGIDPVGALMAIDMAGSVGALVVDIMGAIYGTDAASTDLASHITGALDDGARRIVQVMAQAVGTNGDDPEPPSAAGDVSDEDIDAAVEALIRSIQDAA